MKTGKVYFLRRHDGLIKIGYTANLKRRLEALTKSHGALEVVRIINGDKQREKRLHHEFAAHHEFGEWFRDSQQMRALIEQIRDGVTAEIVDDDAKRAWLIGEAQMADEARGILARLVQVTRQRSGLKHEPALTYLADTYGFSVWLLRNFHSGRASTVSAFAMKRLRGALIAEMEGHRDDLLATLKQIEADERAEAR